MKSSTRQNKTLFPYQTKEKKGNSIMNPCVPRKFCLFNISPKTVVVSSLQINNVSDVFYVFLKYIKTLSKRFFGNESGKNLQCSTSSGQEFDIIKSWRKLKTVKKKRPRLRIVKVTGRFEPEAVFRNWEKTHKLQL